MQENQTPVFPVVTPQVVVEQPKQSNFLVILLSILLLLSVAIAGFFAYQTQKLVKELTMLRVEPTPIATVEPTMKPVGAFDNIESWTTVKNEEGFSFKYPPLHSDSSVDFRFIDAISSDCSSKVKSETRIINGQKLVLDYYIYLNKGICSSDGLNHLLIQVPGYPLFMTDYKDVDKDLAMSFIDTIVSTFKVDNK